MEFDFYTPIFDRLPSLEEWYKGFSKEDVWFLYSCYCVDDEEEDY